MKRKYEILVIGGSAGSIQVLKQILSDLKRINIPIVVGMHRMAHDDTSNLIRVVQYSTKMRVTEPKDGESLLPNRVYVAPADHHLVIEPFGKVSLSRTPLVHYSRPSIDVLFMSISQTYAQNVIAVLVTGANRDGAMGLKMIRDAGGMTMVQDPKDCFIETMTREALDVTNVDYILKANTLGKKINEILWINA